MDRSLTEKFVCCTSRPRNLIRYRNSKSTVVVVIVFVTAAISTCVTFVGTMMMVFMVSASRRTTVLSFSHVPSIRSRHTFLSLIERTTTKTITTVSERRRLLLGRILEGSLPQPKVGRLPVRHFVSNGNSEDNMNPTEQQQQQQRRQVQPIFTNSQESKSKRSAPKIKKTKKFKVVDKLSHEQESKLALAFDELARKEGFDSSMAFYADDATFEDDFGDDDFVDFERDSPSVNDNLTKGDYFDADGGDSMDARIAEAMKDSIQGRVTVPVDLDEFAADVTADELRRLGFRHEENPFGYEETTIKTPSKDAFTLITNALVCSACGSDFQSTNEQRPGYLPPAKFSVQVKLSKIEELQKLQQKSEKNEWSTEDEIEWLLQTSGMRQNEQDSKNAALVDIPKVAEEMGLDLDAMTQKKTICRRCHNLQNFGKVENILRPGWTTEPLLSQENFRNLLRPLSQKTAVIIALVDLFDFSGSVLPELDSIAGNNPVILAANKVDLLPSQMGQVRVESWVRRELAHIGIKSLANIGGAVRLVSCKTGFGIDAMLLKARTLAEELDCDIYIVGAANSGKSTLMNRILNERNSPEIEGKIRAGNKNKIKSSVTISPLPGTTLQFISADLGGGRMLYDTPGLLVPGTLTQLLTPEELKMVVPKNNVEPITFRIADGKCVLIGGLAKIELIDDSRPFLFTFFVANAVKLHPTDSAKASAFLSKHAGTMLTPPLPPGEERLKELGEFEEHVVEIEGTGWKEAAADISLMGLGWIAVTGAGLAKIKISVPKGVVVEVRPPLMPFDVWETTAKYTGSRSVRKTTKTTKRKGVGRN